MGAPKLKDLLERSLERHASRVAIEETGGNYSYADIDKLSGRTARVIAAESDGPAVVGLVGPRTARSIAGALAVVRRGDCFLPLDGSASADRLTYVLKTCGASILLVDGELGPALVEAAARCGVRVIDLSRIEEVWDPAEGAGAPGVASGGFTYMLATSGSTGMPKVVHGTGSALAHYVAWQLDFVAGGPEERYAQLAPFTFDFSFKEWLVPLCGGATVVLGPESLRFDYGALLSWIARRRISVACVIPTMLRGLVKVLEASPGAQRREWTNTLRTVMVSGEALDARSVVAWQRLVGPRPELIQLYGPTESTVIKVAGRIPHPYEGATRWVPIGDPINGARLEILDAQREPLGLGGVGEVAIVSEHLALGYVGAEQATTARFVRTGRERTADERTLLTGDRGHFDPDRGLIFAGRVDRQVKRAGVRIELEAVEGALRQIPEVVDAVVVPVGEEDTRIEAFYITGARGPSSRATLDEALSAILPAGYLPDGYSWLEALPRLSNGKPDVPQLCALAMAKASASGPCRSDDLVPRVIEIWRHVLKHDDVTPHTNFFEAGGDSVLMVDVMRQLQIQLSCTVSFVDLFTNPTPLSLSDSIVGAAGGRSGSEAEDLHV